MPKHPSADGLARPRSLRAQARRAYEHAAARRNASPALPTDRGRAGNARELMRLVRRAYERSAIPVAALAKLIGVTERTLYKYVERGGWRRRYAGARAAARRRDAERAAKTKRAVARHHSQTQTRGTGGRFVAKAGPARHGLKALDPAGARRARAALVEALALAAQGERAARAQRAGELDAAILVRLAQLHRRAWRAQDRARATPPRRRSWQPPAAGG